MKTKYYIKKVDGLNIPFKANDSDAGYDVIATSAPKIVGEQIGGGFYRRIDYIEYETNLYIAPETKASFDRNLGNTFTNFHTDLRPRSSISKYNLVLANSVGLIDKGYRNQILARFKYIWNPEDYTIENGALMGAVNVNKIYNHGDKICQLVPMETHDIEFVVVDNLDNNDRGGGFGSTDNQPKKQSSVQFTLKEKTTIEKFFRNEPTAKVEMAKAYYSNFPGEMYVYEENGIRGICVVDYSGTVLTKTPTEKIK